MALLDSNTLRTLLNAHGIRPFDVKVEFAPEQAGDYFKGFNDIIWSEYPTKPQTLAVGYGADMFPFTCKMWDPATVEAEHMSAPQIQLKIPQNGDFVCVTVIDQTTDTNGRVLFRGQVRSVHKHNEDAGVTYLVEASSDVSRLNDPKIVFRANFLNNPANPTPLFDPNGNVYLSRLKTVYEIAQDIMNFPDPWGTNEYFQFSDIDWNGLDTDPRCGLYIPPTLEFDESKGEALQKLLDTAGNFTFVYVPQRVGRGKLRIVELNLECNRCGDLWNISWAPETLLGQTILPNYAFNYFVSEDDTEWNTKQTANTISMTAGPIRFYSGNWMLPEIIDGDGNHNVVGIDNDSPFAQQKRAVNPDYTYYRFTSALDKAQDIRTGNKQYPVGLPLYPDWNIHEDYLPSILEIQDAQLPSSGAIQNAASVTMTADKYRGLVEYQTFTVGDEIARGPTHLRYVNNLKAYQAWYTDEPCPACTPTEGWPAGAPGLGLVQAVYTGPDNEPVLRWEAVGPAGRRTVSATDTLNTGERLVYSVTNYIFNPKDFGTGAAPTGLTPWDPTTGTPYGDGKVSHYPLPWKNLCPYCRGTGMNPKYKLRHIEPELFEGRNNQIIQPSGVSEIPIDPDFTQTGPESWEQTQSRLTIKEGAWLQVETNLLRPSLPSFAFRNQPFSTIKTYPTSDQKNAFPHMLQFKSIGKRLAGMFGKSISDPASQIVPSDWTCNVPFTTVQMGAGDVQIDYVMGRVIFKEPQFIACVKPFNDYVQFARGTYLITNGMLTPRTVGRGSMFADRNFNPTGFWRHSRVWMIFYYTRPLYYEYFLKDNKGNAIPDTEFDAPTPDGGEATYVARMAIHDGRMVIEVQKKWPGRAEAGGTVFGTGNRILRKSITDDSSFIETTPADLYKMPLPEIVNVVPADLETYKKGLGLDFVRARMLKMETTTPGEAQAEMEGYTSTDYANAVVRPKLFSWRLRDDRSRLLGRCLKELEFANNLMVQGALTVVGISHDISRGLGFINKPNQGTAVVKQITYEFSDAAMRTTLEVAREEARVGLPIPTQEDLMHNFQKKQLGQQRLIETLRAAQEAQNNQAQLPAQVSEINSAAGALYRGS